MDLIKLFEPISESVSEVITWLYRVPKQDTGQNRGDPGLCSSFLASESKKDSHAQFQEYMLPAMKDLTGDLGRSKGK
jgi:hypothetical protein